MLPGRWIDDGLGNCGEISLKFRRGGRKRDRCRRRCSEDGLLPASEEEQAIMLDRTSDGSAKLVPLLLVYGGGKVVSCVDRAVPQKFEEVAVEGIGSGFCNDVDPSSRSLAVAGRNRTRLHAELLQQVRKRDGKVY